MLGLRPRPRRIAPIPLVLALLALLMAPLAAGMAAPNALQPATREVTVATGTLNVRSGPGLSHPVTDTVSRGEVYRTGGEGVAADGYSWSTLLTTTDVALGWVADMYLSTSAGGGGGEEIAGAFAVGSRVLVTTDLNFRTGPGTGNGIIRALRAGSVLTLTDGPVAASGYVWYQGRTTQATGAETGWVIQDGLTAADVEMPDPATAYDAGATVHVTSDGLRLRAEPGTGSAIVQQLPAGLTLAVTGAPVGAAGYTWYPVTTPTGASGWVAADYIAFGGGDGTTPSPGTATVDTPRLNLRAGPGTDHDVVGILTGGTALTILDGPVPATGYTWYRVQAPGGATGWVIGEGLTR
jgi:N-acetylmuramoyl-L-alanine amidase